MTLKSNLLNLFYPKFCVSCSSWGSYLCNNCAQTLTQKELICPNCQKPAIGGMTHPLCKRRYGLDGLWSMGAYQGPMRKLIQKLKYRWVSDSAEVLVDLMIEYWAIYSAQILTELKKDQGEGWVVTSVPLHSQRLKWRGFNQSQLLAKLIAQKTGLSYQDSLIRVKNTKPQVTLDGTQRRQNLKEAFSLNSSNLTLNSSFILVDDVWTTGSTIRECCYVLKKAGAKRVWAVTLAR